MNFKIYSLFLFCISLFFFFFGGLIRISGKAIESSGGGYLFDPFFSLGFALSIISIILFVLEEGLETILVPTGPSHEADRQRAETGIKKYKEDETSRQVMISGKYNDGMCFLKSQPIQIYRTLRKAGIPREKIIMESESNSTQENVLYVCEKIREKGINSLLIATDKPHAKRFKMLFEKAKKRGYAPKELEIRTYSEGMDASYGKGRALASYLRDYFTFRRRLK